MLFVIRKRNPYSWLTAGSFVECFDHGCQKCIIKTVNNRVSIRGHEGIILPQSDILPFASRVLKSGFDK